MIRNDKYASILHEIDLQTQLVEHIEIIVDYSEAGINLCEQQHNGIGYINGQLVAFAGVGKHAVLARHITLSQGLAWMIEMQVAGKEGRMTSSWGGSDSGIIRWYRDILAAVNK